MARKRRKIDLLDGKALEATNSHRLLIGRGCGLVHVVDISPHAVAGGEKEERRTDHKYGDIPGQGRLGCSRNTLFEAAKRKGTIRASRRSAQCLSKQHRIYTEHSRLRDGNE